jgi:hypothetical protein
MTKTDIEVLEKKQQFKLKELKLEAKLLHRRSLIAIWVVGAFVVGLSLGKAL